MAELILSIFEMLDRNWNVQYYPISVHEDNLWIVGLSFMTIQSDKHAEHFFRELSLTHVDLHIFVRLLQFSPAPRTLWV